MCPALSNAHKYKAGTIIYSHFRAEETDWGVMRDPPRQILVTRARPRLAWTPEDMLTICTLQTVLLGCWIFTPIGLSLLKVFWKSLSRRFQSWSQSIQGDTDLTNGWENGLKGVLRLLPRLLVEVCGEHSRGVRCVGFQQTQVWIWGIPGRCCPGFWNDVDSICWLGTHQHWDAAKPTQAGSPREDAGEKSTKHLEAQGTLSQRSRQNGRSHLFQKRQWGEENDMERRRSPLEPPP